MKDFYALDQFKNYVEETVAFMRDFFDNDSSVGRLTVSNNRIYYRISATNAVTCPIAQFSGPSDAELRLWADSINVPFSVR